MAQETENVQKPKAELIKKARSDFSQTNFSSMDPNPKDNSPTDLSPTDTSSKDNDPKDLGQTNLSRTDFSPTNLGRSDFSPTNTGSTNTGSNDPESPETVKPSASPEHGERRKVIVVKKKTSSGAPATAVPHAGTSAKAPKKVQPKVITAKVPGTEDAPSTEAKTPENVQTPAPATGKKQDEKHETSRHQDQVPGEKHQTVSENPKEGNEASSFTISQRPAAVAGKVGGKFVGPRPPRTERQGQSQTSNRTGDSRIKDTRTGDSRIHDQRAGDQRTGDQRIGDQRIGDSRTPQGQTGSRPPFRGGDRAPGQGRPFGNNQGANRTGFRPHTGANQRPGFGPRPGGQRPGTGRPGTTQTPPPLPEGKGLGKKTFKAKKPLYTRKEKELEMEEKFSQTKKKITQVANPIPKSIEIMEVVSVSEIARKMNLKASNIIQKLMSMGMMVTINQQIDAETASILASEYGTEVKIISLYDETLIETSSDDAASLSPRPPVVTVMGHVDHGKTKLLDAIRSADVVSGEFGGITQHIGAYIVETPHGRITFLDTPGHEAFTRMRARGAQVTDIVVLVVAADDGVMPQTIEALNHAKEADVPIIVAINKIDKPEANPDRVKSQLSDLGLMPEDWGGQTIFVQVSALKKEGIDKLIDAILLQAEILDLRANYNRSAEGKILESKIDHGRGIVATVIVENGSLRIGDSFVAGIWPGKVRALFSDKGEKLDEATPSMPIEVLGFEGIPNAGDPLQVVDDERTARGISNKRQELKRFEDAKNIKKITIDNLHVMISDGEIQELKVIIKADVQGSAEALRSSLEKLTTKEIRLHVIQALPGAINEGDVDLAIASNAIIIGFNVRPTPKAKLLADQEKVDIRKYNIIYKAVEEIELAMEGMLKPDTKEEVIATVEVRDIFKTPKFGIIAGCYVLTGKVSRSAGINVIRDGIVLHRGKISSLRRFKDDVREVAAGYDCGLGIDGFDNIQTGDQFEVFEVIEVARKLSNG
ncbi:MAG: translation initiation factor IF-2 [Treponema sp.]|nr:translation initiation factor IF-2 [Treponema sp.]